MDKEAWCTDVACDTLPSLNPANPISRKAVIRSVLRLFDEPSYLEIGVDRGHTFNSIKAAEKVAVDPNFRFDHISVAAENSSATFHQTTSDDYFGRIVRREMAFDVIYIDGLHTAEQTIRDLLNAIQFAKPNGVIIVDDVFPSSYSASLPSHGESKALLRLSGDQSKAWMGDVYRLVFFVETFCQQFSYCTVNNNHGQLVMWREPRSKLRSRTLQEVGGMEYKEVFLQKESFRSAPLEMILDQIRAARRYV